MASPQNNGIAILTEIFPLRDAFELDIGGATEGDEGGTGVTGGRAKLLGTAWSKCTRKHALKPCPVHFAWRHLKRVEPKVGCC